MFTETVLAAACNRAYAVRARRRSALTPTDLQYDDSKYISAAASQRAPLRRRYAVCQPARFELRICDPVLHMHPVHSWSDALDGCGLDAGKNQREQHGEGTSVVPFI